jgi:serine protease Do
MKTRKNTHHRLALSITTGASLALMGALASLQGAPDATNAPISERLNIESSPPHRSGPLGGYAEIVERVAPSVVSIAVSKSMAVQAQMQDPFDDPRLRRFFGIPDPHSPGGPPPSAPKQDGLGSGVILTEDGYIVTNNHVVTGADEILVTLPDAKKPYKAEIIGQDPQTDLAVLKIDAKGLPAITAADSSVLKVGDTVLAIGNPFGLTQSVTTGIVSALGRTNVSIVDYENFIQTDASINPGNSGGALVDNKGRLVGINTAILSRTGGNVGIGFAIPINMVANIADQLIGNGEIQRGYFGVLLGELTPDLAEAMGMADNEGVLVNEVLPNTPAAEAGLRNGDVILQVDGKHAQDVRKTRLQVSNTRPGTLLPVIVQRNGKEVSLEVTIGRLPSDGIASIPRNNQDPQSNPADPTDIIEGVTIENLNERYRQQLGIDSQMDGAVITEVQPHSEAAAQGLQPGDVITEVGRQSIASVSEAMKARDEANGNLLLLRVWREGVGRFVALKTS